MTAPVSVCALSMLSDPERACLTGWTYRLARSLAHLAEAWSVADDTNAPKVVEAIAALLHGQRISTIGLMHVVLVNAAGGSYDRGGRGDELVDACVAAAVDRNFREADEAERKPRGRR